MQQFVSCRQVSAAGRACRRASAGAPGHCADCRALVQSGFRADAPAGGAPRWSGQIVRPHWRWPCARRLSARRDWPPRLARFSRTHGPGAPRLSDWPAKSFKAPHKTQTGGAPAVAAHGPSAACLKKKNPAVASPLFTRSAI